MKATYFFITTASAMMFAGCDQSEPTKAAETSDPDRDVKQRADDGSDKKKANFD